MPGDHVKRRMILLASPKFARQLGDNWVGGGGRVSRVRRSKEEEERRRGEGAAGKWVPNLLSHSDLSISKEANGNSKSRGMAKPLLPMGPSSGSS
jgi:hypothetical protein